jgi:site-specific DNA recombinase
MHAKGAAAMTGRQGRYSVAGTERAAINCVIYCRVSTERQEEEGASLPTQEAAAREYARERGYNVIAVFKEAYSGFKLVRPQLDTVRQLIKDKRIDRVIVHTIDRLSRNNDNTSFFLIEAQQAGAEYEFVTEPVDNSIEGVILRTVRSVAAQIHREKIKENTMRGKRARAASGVLMPGSRPLYGYDWNEDHTAYVIKEGEATIVRRVFEAVAAGKSMHQLCKDLTAEGIPTPRGQATWRAVTISNILHHPAYKGEMVAYRWRGYETAKGTRYCTEQDASKWLRLNENVAPALVSAELWGRVQEQLTENKRRASEWTKHDDMHMLRGMIFCGYCRSPMHAAYHSSGSPKYICGNKKQGRGCTDGAHIAAKNIDWMAWYDVVEFLTNPDNLATAERMIDEEINAAPTVHPAAVKLDKVERQLEHIVKQQERLIETIANATNETRRLMAERKFDELDSQRNKLGEERDRLRLEASEADEAMERYRGVRAAFDALKRDAYNDIADADTWEKRRAFMQRLGVRVRVYRKNEPDAPRWETFFLVGLGGNTKGGVHVNQRR